MGDEDDGRALLARRRGQKLHDEFAGERVERSCRLVGEEHLGLGHEATGQGDALGLAARHLSRSVPLHAVETEALEPRPRLGERLGAAHPAQEQGKCDVLLGPQLGDELAELEDEAEVIPP